MKDIKNIADSLDLVSIASLDKAHFKSPWDVKQWHYEIFENPVSHVLVEHKDGALVAYLDYWITFDSATIAKICVDESYRKQGIASSLLDEMMRVLKAEQVLYVTLEVRVSNIAAIKLYEKYGFKKITLKKGYYSDGEDAAYMVMEVK